MTTKQSKIDEITLGAKAMAEEAAPQQVDLADELEVRLFALLDTMKEWCPTRCRWYRGSRECAVSPPGCVIESLLGVVPGERRPHIINRIHGFDKTK